MCWDQHKKWVPGAAASLADKHREETLGLPERSGPACLYPPFPVDWPFFTLGMVK